MTEDGEALRQVARRLCPDGHLVGARRLTGGVSAEIHLVEIERADGSRLCRVVRRHGEGDRAVNPEVAADEARLLALLAGEGLPVPRVHLLDRSGEILPTPYLVIDFLPGDWLAPPASLEARTHPPADALARIHAFAAEDPRLAFLRRRDPLCRAELAQAQAPAEDRTLERRLRTALAEREPLPAGGRPCLLHGDFWPGNWLWQDGRLSALLDWEDAGLGDPLIDLAQARLELVWAWGGAAAERFTARYAALRPFAAGALPAYDLWASLRALLRYGDWGLPPAECRAKRALLHDFAAAALA